MSTVASLPGSPHHTLAQKRKRSRTRSPSQNAELPPSSRRRSASPRRDRDAPGSAADLPRVADVDPVRRAERERQLAARAAEAELAKLNGGAEGTVVKTREEDAARAAFDALTKTRSGGAYVPPARLRAMREAAAAQDKAGAEYQRMSWDALRKSITGIVNRVNVTNIKNIIPELLQENLIRGRGLFCRSVMKAQAASLPFTPVFAALIAVINTKLPQVGELLISRLVSQFRRSFKRNDKIVCQSTTTFIAHLVNQAIAHEIIALQILVMLLERPTDDSIEIAVGFMRESGAYLTENSPKACSSVFERFRAVLNEGTISTRVQYMIEVLMQVRKDRFKDNPIIPEGLDLVEEDEQITHEVTLDAELQVQEGLNIFKMDPNYIQNEEKYKAIKTEILGEDSDADESGSEEDSEESDQEVAPNKEGIEDQTGTNLVNLRRIIYLTIMNALNYEEAVHKLLKVQLQDGEEIEMAKMIIECCSQERSYSNFYGLIGERFSKLNRVWTDCFEETFREYYSTIHRYETNRLRNIGRFFGHLLASDAVSWAVLDSVRLTEEDTTSSSRIFLKIILQELVEGMGLATIKERFADPEVRQSCKGMFPLDNPKDTRFAINYLTSVGLGAATEDMREYLKNAPRLIMAQRAAMLENASSSSSDSDSDTTSSESDSSDSDSDSVASRRKSGRAPPRRSSSPPPVRRGRTRSRTPPRRARSRSDSRSPPPPPKRAASRDRAMRNVSPPPRRDRNGDRPIRDASPPPRRRPDSRERASPPRRPRYDSPPSRAGGYGRADSPPRLGATRDDRERSPPPPPRDRAGPGRREQSRERLMARYGAGGRDEPPHRGGGRDEPPSRGGGRDEPPHRGGGRDEPPIRGGGRDEPAHRAGGRDEPPHRGGGRDEPPHRGADRERDNGYRRR